ncbi:hypothetical protein PCE1_003594 [Barthelona sp. PCE]
MNANQPKDPEREQISQYTNVLLSHFSGKEFLSEDFFSSLISGKYIKNNQMIISIFEALSDEREEEIRKLCSTDYQEFLTSIERLGEVEETIVNLKSQIKDNFFDLDDILRSFTKISHSMAQLYFAQHNIEGTIRVFDFLSVVFESFKQAIDHLKPIVKMILTRNDEYSPDFEPMQPQSILQALELLLQLKEHFLPFLFKYSFYGELQGCVDALLELSLLHVVDAMKSQWNSNIMFFQSYGFVVFKHFFKLDEKEPHFVKKFATYFNSMVSIIHKPPTLSVLGLDFDKYSINTTILQICYLIHVKLKKRGAFFKIYKTMKDEQFKSLLNTMESMNFALTDTIEEDGRTYTGFDIIKQRYASFIGFIAMERKVCSVIPVDESHIASFKNSMTDKLTNLFFREKLPIYTNLNNNPTDLDLEFFLQFIALTRSWFMALEFLDFGAEFEKQFWVEIDSNFQALTVKIFNDRIFNLSNEISPELIEFQDWFQVGSKMGGQKKKGVSMVSSVYKRIKENRNNSFIFLPADLDTFLSNTEIQEKYNLYDVHSLNEDDLPDALLAEFDALEELRHDIEITKATMLKLTGESATSVEDRELLDYLVANFTGYPSIDNLECFPFTPLVVEIIKIVQEMLLWYSAYLFTVADRFGTDSNLHVQSNTFINYCETCFVEVFSDFIGQGFVMAYSNRKTQFMSFLDGHNRYDSVDLRSCLLLLPIVSDLFAMGIFVKDNLHTMAKNIIDDVIKNIEKSFVKHHILPFSQLTDFSKQFGVEKHLDAQFQQVACNFCTNIIDVIKVQIMNFVDSSGSDFTLTHRLGSIAQESIDDAVREIQPSFHNMVAMQTLEGIILKMLRFFPRDFTEIIMKQISERLDKIILEPILKGRPWNSFFALQMSRDAQLWTELLNKYCVLFGNTPKILENAFATIYNFCDIIWFDMDKLTFLSNLDNLALHRLKKSEVRTILRGYHEPKRVKQSAVPFLVSNGRVVKQIIQELQ